MKKIYRYIVGDSLYRNSSFLLASNIVVSLLGFLFWSLATRFFSSNEVGIASTLISSTDLVVSFATLGLNIGLVRYLPTSDKKNDHINSVFLLTAISSTTVSIIFILGIRHFSPSLLLIHNSIIAALSFVLFIIFLNLAESIKSVFRSFRRSEFVLIKNSVFHILKILFLFVFVNLGALGIFSSFLAALIVSCLLGIFFLIKKFDYKLKPAINMAVLRKMFRFSFANYISEFLERAPRLGLPLIITNLASPEKAAYYYIDMSIAMFLFMLPDAIASSFYAESSANETELAIHTRKAVKAFVLVLIPAIIMFVFFGKYLLLLFGKEYSDNGFVLLRLLSLSTIFVAINSLFSNIVRVRFKMNKLILVNSVGALTILGLSLLFIKSSIAGVGWAWLIGNALMSTIYLTTFLYKSS